MTIMQAVCRTTRRVSGHDRRESSPITSHSKLGSSDAKTTRHMRYFPSTASPCLPLHVFLIREMEGDGWVERRGGQTLNDAGRRGGWRGRFWTWALLSPFCISITDGGRGRNWEKGKSIRDPGSCRPPPFPSGYHSSHNLTRQHTRQRASFLFANQGFFFLLLIFFLKRLYCFGFQNHPPRSIRPAFSRSPSAFPIRKDNSSSCSANPTFG